MLWMYLQAAQHRSIVVKIKHRSKTREAGCRQSCAAVRRTDATHPPVQDDTDVPERVLNVSFSALDSAGTFGGSFDGPFLSQQHIQEKVYLNRARLASLASVQVRIL